MTYALEMATGGIIYMPNFMMIASGIEFFFISGVGLSPLGTAAISGLLYKPQMIDEGDCGARWNEDWQGKPKYSEKTCPSATLSTTNPT
jgi:hypothetical protein